MAGDTSRAGHHHDRVAHVDAGPYVAVPDRAAMATLHDAPARRPVRADAVDWIAVGMAARHAASTQHFVVPASRFERRGRVGVARGSPR